MNHLYFGDNLSVMQDMSDNTVDYCYADPPFGTGRDYNVFLHAKGTRSQTQTQAYTDTWKWGEAAERDYRYLQDELAGDYPETAQLLESFLRVQGPSRQMAYLAFMAPRLCHIHRILKKTGSFYLHCDAKMSHYLKVIVDSIFGYDNFRNEVIWHYTNKLRDKRKRVWQAATDTLLFYTKSDDYTFHPQYEARDVPKKYPRIRKVDGKKVTVRDAKGQVEYVVSTEKLRDNVLQIPMLTGGKEKLGYETQKPIRLLELLLRASSSPGDVVLDPFCGCGTTLDAAHGLGRRWLGIDKTILAIEPILRRMQQRHPETFTRGVDYEVHGYPQSLQDAIKLAEIDRFGFETWVIGLLPKIAVTRKTGDDGFDGRGSVLTHVKDGVEQYTHILVEVKSGKNLHRGMLRDFRTAMRDQGADLGIFVTLTAPTDGMRGQAAREGFLTLGNTRVPRLQFWHLTDRYFRTGVPEIILPQQWMVDTRQQAEMHHGEEQVWLI